MVLLVTNHEHLCQLPLPPRCTVERVIRQGYIRQAYRISAEEGSDCPYVDGGTDPALTLRR